MNARHRYKSSPAMIVGSLMLGLAAGAWNSQACAGDDPAKQLGTVDFANSCAPAAQESFERGVALLHSFAFKDGEAAFREALAKDPHCAIANWGIATLQIGNTFSTGASPEKALVAKQAIELGRSTPTTPREHAYIEAVASYYDNFAGRLQPERMQALSAAYEALAANYPDDDEAQIFDGLYLTSSQSPADKTHARALKAALILERQFATHPDHPGAAHYLIHSYDFPDVSKKGLFAAICYSGIAPDAAHALHMPSHIFTRVGMWTNSIDTNAKSIVSASAENDPGAVLHAMDYTVYADLQLARDQHAGALVDEARRLSTPTLGSKYARAAIPARYALERDQWKDAAALPDPEDSVFVYTKAMTLFARAIGAARSGDPVAAEKDAAGLASFVDKLKSGGDRYWATEVEAQHRGALAWIAFAKGDRDGAVGLMRSAADMEDASEKNAVSPGRIMPARELLGDMLLEVGQPEAALAAYEASQIQDPRRFRSLYGAGKAAAALGDVGKSRLYFGRLLEMADGAGTRPTLVAARQYMAANAR